MPAWSSSVDAAWGSAAAWSIASGGQSGKFLKATRASAGSSAKVKVFDITPYGEYTISIYMKGPSSSASYWVEAAFRLGNRGAASFDSNPGSWTMIAKFSDTGTNGNGNKWVKYSASFNSLGYSQVSVGFKSGNLSGTAPAASWDTLVIE